MPLNRLIRQSRPQFAPDIFWDFTKGKYLGAHPYDCLACTQSHAGLWAANSGGVLVNFPANTLRITDRGLLSEVARTNLALWSDDLTNAAWTKSNVTAAKDQTGPDGVANSASSIVATAGNGTCLQAITDASKARFQSAYVKRLVGTGTINMTMDNGTTWTDVTSQISSTAWTAVTIPTQTLANPTIGFRIVTNTDKIAVAKVQSENGASLTSPIDTTSASASRASDVIAISNRLLKLLATFTFTFQASGSGSPSKTGAAYFLDFDNDTNNDVLFCASSPTTRIATFPNGALNGTIGGAGTLDLPVRAAVATDPSGTSVVANYGTVTTGAGVFNAITNPVLAGTTGANQQYGGYITKVAAWSRKVSDPLLALMTA